MLREEVLRCWKTCQEKVISFKKANFTKEERERLAFLVDKLAYSEVLPDFSLTLAEAEQKLELWNSSQYKSKILQERREVGEKATGNDILESLDVSHWSSCKVFEILATGWWQTKQSNEAGPTIEEVD